MVIDVVFLIIPINVRTFLSKKDMVSNNLNISIQVSIFKVGM